MVVPLNRIAELPNEYAEAYLGLVKVRIANVLPDEKDGVIFQWVKEQLKNEVHGLILQVKKDPKYFLDAIIQDAEKKNAKSSTPPSSSPPAKTQIGKPQIRKDKSPSLPPPLEWFSTYVELAAYRTKKGLSIDDGTLIPLLFDVFKSSLVGLRKQLGLPVFKDDKALFEWAETLQGSRQHADLMKAVLEQSKEAVLSLSKGSQESQSKPPSTLGAKLPILPPPVPLDKEITKYFSKSLAEQLPRDFLQAYVDLVDYRSKMKVQVDDKTIFNRMVEVYKKCLTKFRKKNGMPAISSTRALMEWSKEHLSSQPLLSSELSRRAKEYAQALLAAEATTKDKEPLHPSNPVTQNPAGTHNMREPTKEVAASSFSNAKYESQSKPPSPQTKNQRGPGQMPPIPELKLPAKPTPNPTYTHSVLEPSKDLAVSLPKGSQEPASKPPPPQTAPDLLQTKSTQGQGQVPPIPQPKLQEQVPTMAQLPTGGQEPQSKPLSPPTAPDLFQTKKTQGQGQVPPIPQLKVQEQVPTIAQLRKGGQESQSKPPSPQTAPVLFHQQGHSQSQGQGQVQTTPQENVKLAAKPSQNPTCTHSVLEPSKEVARSLPKGCQESQTKPRRWDVSTPAGPVNMLDIQRANLQAVHCSGHAVSAAKLQSLGLPTNLARDHTGTEVNLQKALVASQETRSQLRNAAKFNPEAVHETRTHQLNASQFNPSTEIGPLQQVPCQRIPHGMQPQPPQHLQQPQQQFFAPRSPSLPLQQVHPQPQPQSHPASSPNQGIFPLQQVPCQHVPRGMQPQPPQQLQQPLVLQTQPQQQTRQQVLQSTMPQPEPRLHTHSAQQQLVNAQRTSMQQAFQAIIVPQAQPQTHTQAPQQKVANHCRQSLQRLQQSHQAQAQGQQLTAQQVFEQSSVSKLAFEGNLQFGQAKSLLEKGVRWRENEQVFGQKLERLQELYHVIWKTHAHKEEPTMGTGAIDAIKNWINVQELLCRHNLLPPGRKGKLDNVMSKMLALQQETRPATTKQTMNPSTAVAPPQVPRNVFNQAAAPSEALGANKRSICGSQADVGADSCQPRDGKRRYLETPSRKGVSEEKDISPVSIHDFPNKISQAASGGAIDLTEEDEDLQMQVAVSKGIEDEEETKMALEGRLPFDTAKRLIDEGASWQESEQVWESNLTKVQTVHTLNETSKLTGQSASVHSSHYKDVRNWMRVQALLYENGKLCGGRLKKYIQILKQMGAFKQKTAASPSAKRNAPPATVTQKAPPTSPSASSSKSLTQANPDPSAERSGSPASDQITPKPQRIEEDPDTCSDIDTAKMKGTDVRRGDPSTPKTELQTLQPAREKQAGGPVNLEEQFQESKGAVAKAKKSGNDTEPQPPFTKFSESAEAGTQDAYVGQEMPSEVAPVEPARSKGATNGKRKGREKISPNGTQTHSTTDQSKLHTNGRKNDSQEKKQATLSTKSGGKDSSMDLVVDHRASSGNHSDAKGDKTNVGEGKKHSSKKRKKKRKKANGTTSSGSATKGKKRKLPPDWPVLVLVDDFDFSNDPLFQKPSRTSSEKEAIQKSAQKKTAYDPEKNTVWYVPSALERKRRIQYTQKMPNYYNMKF